jgi:hypothetical protein
MAEGFPKYFFPFRKYSPKKRLAVWAVDVYGIVMKRLWVERRRLKREKAGF